MEIDLDKTWDIAKEKYKIQQIREEWEWMINKTVNLWESGQNILEIGCYDGGSSYYLSQFARNMVTMDWHNPARFVPEGFGCKEYVYIGGDSHSHENLMKLGLQTDDIWDQIFDYAFIDGDHGYEGVKADFVNVLPYIDSGCPIVFHDIAISDFHHQHGCYVGEFWRDLKKQYPNWKTEEFQTHDDWAGIGIIWKP